VTAKVLQQALKKRVRQRGLVRKSSCIASQVFSCTLIGEMLEPERD